MQWRDFESPAESNRPRPTNCGYFREYKATIDICKLNSPESHFTHTFFSERVGRVELAIAVILSGGRPTLCRPFPYVAICITILPTLWLWCIWNRSESTAESRYLIQALAECNQGFSWPWIRTLVYLISYLLCSCLKYEPPFTNISGLRPASLKCCLLLFCTVGQTHHCTSGSLMTADEGMKHLLTKSKGRSNNTKWYILTDGWPNKKYLA